MVFKPCKYLCNTNIEMREDQTSLKWLPYEESGRKHDCPNSEYNKKKRGTGIASGNDHLQTYEQQQEKNDHGNELVSKSIHPSQVPTFVQKRKPVLRKWFTSNNPDVLTIAVNDFVKANDGRAGQTYAVWRPDIASMEYGECVYYEAEV